jgi:hypothetical protein
MTNLTSLFDELASIANRRYYRDLGESRVFLHTLQDSIVIEFPRFNMKAEFDVELFRPGAGNWRAVVEHQLALLAHDVGRLTSSGRGPFDDGKATPLPPGRLDSRHEKIKMAMAGIAAGKHMEPAPLTGGKMTHRFDDRSPIHLPTVFAEFCLGQKDVKRSRALLAFEREAASKEWSRQLRAKLAESKHREKHQVLCDLQDEP